MCKKPILLISLLFLIFSFTTNAYEISYNVTEDTRGHWNFTDDTSEFTGHGSETSIFLSDVDTKGWLKFTNIYTGNMTGLELTCKVNGTAIWRVYTGNISELSLLNSWSEPTLSYYYQPCYACSDIGFGTCWDYNVSLTPCHDSGAYGVIVNAGTIGNVGSEQWETATIDLGVIDWENNSFQTVSFFLNAQSPATPYESNPQYILTRESNEPCNLNVTGIGGVPVTTTTLPVDLDLTVNVYDSINTTEVIENANVTISNLDFPPPITNDVSNLTNSTGTVVFGITIQGEYEVIVRRFDYATSSDTILMYYENKTLDIYLDRISTNTYFNFTVYNKDTDALIPTAKLEFIECQGGDSPFLDCALNYPNGIYTLIATRYTNSSGNFEGTIQEMTNCFLIGFRKDDYLIPQPDVFVNSNAICLDESWYSSETNSYTVPYFDYYMFPDVTNVTVLYTVRDGDTYIKLSGVNISIDYPTGSDTQLTDSNGEATFTNGNGCWDLTVTELPYHILTKTDCFYDDGNYNRTLYLLLNESESDSNISTYNLTGYVFADSDALPLVDMYLDCEIFCPAGYRLYETHDITITNTTGQYRFESIRENAECDIRAISNGYSEEVEHFAMLDNEEINLTLTYLGKEFDITGIVTDCNSLNPLVARVEIWHCGNVTDYDPSLPCNYLIAQLTNEDGEFDFVNILEGYIQFVITEEYHEEISQVELIQTDTELDFCLYEGQSRYWLRGMVQNVSLSGDSLLYQPIEAQIKVYNKDTNALVEQFETNWINGYFAFELRKDYYIVIAEAYGKSESATIYLDHNYGQEELILTIGEPSTQEIQTDEFIATLSGLLPSVIILFIFLMVVQALKHVSGR